MATSTKHADDSPPVTAEGKPDTSNEAAIAKAVDKAIHPEIDPKIFEFGGVKFLIRHLTLRRERKFMSLFPVLEAPFAKIRQLQKEGMADNMSVGQFLTEMVAAHGDHALDILIEIGAACLDNAKPNSMKNVDVNSEWVEENVAMTELAEVIAAQVQEQAWGNFFQRLVGMLPQATTSHGANQ